MKDLNLNIERWSILDTNDATDYMFNIDDVISLADSISWANSDDLICDFNMHEYTH